MYPQQPTHPGMAAQPYPLPPARPGSGGIPVIAGVAALCVLGAIGFGFGIVVGGGGAKLFANPNGTPAQRSAALPLNQSLNSQVALYRLQHNDYNPDFVLYPNWEQFTLYTDMRGGTSQTKNRSAVYGPYLQQAPVNPLNRLGTIEVVNSAPAVGSTVPGGKSVGFVFCKENSRFYLTDAGGTRVIDLALAAGGRGY